MPEDLVSALDALRPLLVDPDALVHAVGSGRRRGAEGPSVTRADLRPVDLRTGRHLQIVTTDGLRPTTRNLPPGDELGTTVDGLLAEPFGSWYVETRDRVLQLRVTKRGLAQVHESRPSRREIDVAVHDRAPRHLLDPADPLFAALGADADKRRQVDAFLRALAPAARRVTGSADRPLRVLDLGCGNAYLTFAAHRWLAGEHPAGVHTTGIDVRPDMVDRNRRLAAELGLAPGREPAADPGRTTGLDFEAAAIDTVGPGGPVDIVLALHACDTATDDALAHAVTLDAPVLLAAPCCHHDLQRRLSAGEAVPPHPYGALTRHAILRERFADVLTDAVRADILRLLGYRVDVVEFVDSRHTPRNVLLRAVRTGAPPTARRVAEYRDLVAAWGIRPALAERLAPRLTPVIGA